MSNLLLRKKELMKKKIAIMLCIISVIFCVNVAYAAGVADLIYSIVGLLISFIADLIIGTLQLMINFVLQAMTVSIDEMQSWTLLSGFENFAEGIRLFAFAIASVAILWQLFTYFFGPILGNKQEVSVITLFMRTLVFVPLTYIIQDFALIIFGEFQKIYTALLDAAVYDSATGSFVVNVAGQINRETFITDIAGDSPVLDNLFDTMTMSVRAVISIVISSLFLILILWNLIKLILEIAQRFAAMLVYAYLSPLAAAAGVIGNGEILKRAFALFMSSGVLWVLNVWCITVAVSLINKIGVAISHGIAGTFVWAFLCYGFLKVVQQLDDIFNAVGATNVQFHGTILDDMLSLGRTMPMLAKGAEALGLTGAASRAVGFVKNKLTGRTPDSPASATFSNNLGGQSSGAGTGSRSTSTEAVGQDAASATGSKPKPPSPEVTKLNDALNNTKDAEATSEKLLAMHEANPNVFDQPDVKNWIGKNQLGLKSGTQKMLGTNYGEEGNLSAIVATAKGNGSVRLSKVDGIGETKATPYHGAQLEANTMSTGKNGSNHVNDFTQNGAVGKDMATLSYTDKYGVARMAQVESKGVDKNGNAKYAVHTDTGSVSNYVAPADTTAADFAAAINGTASPEVMEKFTKHAEAHPHGSEGKGCYTSAQSYMWADTEKGGTVFAGTAMENSPNTSVTHASPNGDVTWNRVEHGKSDKDTWSASIEGKEVGRVSVPSDTGAASVAYQAFHSSDSEFASVRESIGIKEDDNPTVSFTPNLHATGPEPFRDKRGAGAAGQKEDGSEWSDYGSITPETDDEGNTKVNIGYHVVSDNPDFAGKHVSEKATIQKSGSYEQEGETYSTFTVTRGTSEDSSKTFTVKGDYTPEQLATSLYSEERTSHIGGAEQIRSMLGIVENYDDKAIDDIDDLLKVANRMKNKFKKFKKPEKEDSEDDDEASS